MDLLSPFYRLTTNIKGVSTGVVNMFGRVRIRTLDIGHQMALGPGGQIRITTIILITAVQHGENRRECSHDRH